MPDTSRVEVLALSAHDLRVRLPDIAGLAVLVRRERLVSQLANPNLAAEDVILLVGTSRGVAVATLGIIPARIDGVVPARFGWLHNWVSLPSHQGIGGILLLKAYRAYDGRLAVSGCTPMAERVYLASRKLILFQEKSGLSAYRRISASMLPPRWKERWPVAQAARGATWMHNFVMERREQRWKAKAAKLLDGLSVRFSASFGPETAGCISDSPRTGLFSRTIEELNWVARFDPGEDAAVEIVSLADGLRVLGAALLSRQGPRLRIPYFFCTERHLAHMACAIGLQTLKMPVTEILSYSAEFWRGWDAAAMPGILRKGRRFAYLVSPSLAAQLPKCVSVQDGDGDGFI